MSELRGETVTAGGVLIFEGDHGYEVHLDTHDGRFALVDAEMEREWSGLTVEEVNGLHDALTAALTAPEEKVHSQRVEGLWCVADRVFVTSRHGGPDGYCDAEHLPAAQVITIVVSRHSGSQEQGR